MQRLLPLLAARLQRSSQGKGEQQVDERIEQSRSCPHWQGEATCTESSSEHQAKILKEQDVCKNQEIQYELWHSVSMARCFFTLMICN
jgi:hypothetical protein